MRRLGKSNKGRSKNGCVSAFIKFLLFLLFIILVALYIINQYNGSDLSMKIRKNQYPIKYEHFVDKYSESYNLDKYLVLSVIRTESRFDVYAVSSVGAKGLMQITDETGRDCAKKIGIDEYRDDLLFDPETNIRIGCYYLSRLIKKYENNVDTALAAYNGGPGNVDKWLENQGGTGDGEDLADIPFPETRNYVKRVNEAYRMYKSIYEVKTT